MLQLRAVPSMPLLSASDLLTIRIDGETGGEVRRIMMLVMFLELSDGRSHSTLNPEDV